MDRLPSTRVPRVRRAQGRRSTAPTRQPRRGVGGERVLDQPLLGDRPRRRMGIRQYFESPYRPGQRSPSTNTTSTSSETPCPACPRPPPKQGLTPLAVHAQVRCFEIPGGAIRRARAHRHAGRHSPRPTRSATTKVSSKYRGRPDCTTRSTTSSVTCRSSAMVRSEWRSTVRSGSDSPLPRARTEMYSPMLRDWGWPEHAMPGYIKSHVHWEDLDMEAWRTHSAADVPFADFDPHSLRSKPSGSTRSAIRTRCGSTRLTPNNSASR